MAGPALTTRRIFLAGAPLLLCGGCGKSFMSDVPTVWRTYLTKGDDLHVTRADIDRIPYASLAARIGDGPQGLLVLSRYDGDKLEWISADRKLIVTRRGRIVRTVGLAQDLTGTTFLSPDPVGKPSAALATSPPALRSVDIDPGHRDGIVVTSSFERLHDDTIDILGEKYPTELWQERGAAPLLDWEFVNLYWIDPRTGFVWRSQQQPLPALAPFDIVIYRRAA
jgi:hypothetical protein